MIVTNSSGTNNTELNGKEKEQIKNLTLMGSIGGSSIFCVEMDKRLVDVGKYVLFRKLNLGDLKET